MKPTKEDILEYIKAVIHDLDGSGLIVTDWELIEEHFEYYPDFPALREMFEAEN